MTIHYSTNFMGPVHLQWFEERNTTEHWYGGRIDIYGLDERDHYAGMDEYSLPVMDEPSWAKFQDWLDEYTSEELTSYEDLIIMFERETKHKIRWADDVFGDIE